MTVWCAHKDSRTNERNRIESRNKYVYLWSVDFQLNCQGNSMGERTAASPNGAETIRHAHTKTKS